MGKFSARGTISVSCKRSGGYIGEKSNDNSLVKWTKEDWGLYWRKT